MRIKDKGLSKEQQGETRGPQIDSLKMRVNGRGWNVRGLESESIQGLLREL